MKVLFVCSGNSTVFDVTPFIRSQAESLEQLGIEVDFFLVKGKGFKGYLKNIPNLKNHLQTHKYQIIHAHYVLSAWIALLANRNTPLICSFMGSDTYGDTNKKGRLKLASYKEIMLAKLIQPFLSAIIVKSENLFQYIWMKQKAHIIPNGIDLGRFILLNRKDAKEKFHFPTDEKMLLFTGDPGNERKNYALLERSTKYINTRHKIVNSYPVKHEDIPTYLNAADVLVLTSYLEGSPNIVKEAMSCNCPVVATQVGDIKWLFGDEAGYYLTDFDPRDLAVKIEQAFHFVDTKGRTNGRNRILELGLDSETIARKIKQIYDEVITK